MEGLQKPQQPQQQPQQYPPRQYQDDYVRTKLPDRRRGEMFAIAEQLHGASHIRVVCADGKSRMARIPGKIKKRLWIRQGDLVIIRPWEFQKDEKCDVIFRYTKTQATALSRRGLIPKEVDVF